MIKKQDAFYKEQLARLEERVLLLLVSDSLNHIRSVPMGVFKNQCIRNCKLVFPRLKWPGK